MYSARRPTLCSAAPDKKFSLGKVANSPAGRALKKVEVSRVARLKTVGQRISEAAKLVDQEARTQLVQDLEEVTRTLTDLIQREEAQDE